jgi:recombination protein RecT
MANELKLYERGLELVAPNLEQVLKSYGMPVERLIRTVMVSLERLPALQECPQQSVLNSAMTAACLGLEVDGVTGQGFLIPFKDKGTPKAQFLVGYKGYNTMAARSGYTLGAAVVREGDTFDYQIGTGGFVVHRPKLGNESGRKILAAYAKAEMPGRAPIIQVLSIDELEAVRMKSPGAKRAESPWNDKPVGYPAMCAKTAKRRLGRDMPLNVMVMAAALEDQVDLGRPAHITPERGVVIDVEPSTTPTEPKTFRKRDKFEIFFTSSNNPTVEREDVTRYKSTVVQILDKAKPEQLRQFKKDNKAYIEGLLEEGYNELSGVLDRLISIEDQQ